ncbi:RNA-binding protein 5-B [Lucilia cuprina]|uniref:RNA-binding protein 5-B n=1 Tax=Lucilia cuprina TaxID=7375 RepID=UPI001F0544F9|nr:RNA-binding protein 5-B [Lucilia cuprina]
MDRRSRSISPRRYRNGGSGGGGGYRRYSRSRSRSRDRGREQNYRNKRNTRSRSRDRNHRRGNSNDNDLYRDIINQDYQDERNYGGNGGYSRGGGGGGGNSSNYRSRNNDDNYMDDRDHYWSDNRSRDKGRDQDRDYDNRDRRDNRRYGGNGNNNSNHNNRRYNTTTEHDSDDSDETMSGHYYNKTPSNTIIVLGLQSHITEADIMSLLIQMGMAPASIRLIRKRTTGASRGFAFVEFNTVDEAAHWMELTQGVLQLQDTCRATLQYSHSLQSNKTKINPTDWYCGKCGMFNFKRRDSCFKCYASREESERGGEGSDEISNILTKKIMLRNLDVLTNEEGVLTAITQHAPDLAKKISKVLVSRDALTQTSRGICYLHFESLVDSMNMHNLLSTLEPPLKIDNKEVIITYCIDHENRQIVPKKPDNSSSTSSTANTTSIGPLTAAEMASVSSGGSGEYTLADVPRLAEYSASMYASTPAEHAHYLQYYTEYYISEITKGSYGNLPTDTQMTEANSGAAVALSAIQRKQRKMNSIETTATAAAVAAATAAAAAKASLAARTIVTPKGNDGKIYPTPDVSLYQYDETSGYYYDPTTGLYYDAHSQYYYNNETGAYLYWDQRKSSYVLATPAAAAATIQDVVKQETETEAKTSTAADEEATKKEKKESGSGNKHDKVKVAKKIVKDMEKWAKQLNQKKDYTVVATPQPILNNNRTEDTMRPSTSAGISSGYADLGFSILEKKTTKLNASNTFMSPMSLGAAASNKLIPSYGSDSDEDNIPPPPASAKVSCAASAGDTCEKDYVDFQKLTCLLCKRAFQSLEILQKHLKMSNLHKENLAKHNLERGLTVQQQQQQQQAEQDSLTAALSYRDRAKERRLKYGESDPPPPNRSRERFEKEINNLTSRQKQKESPAMPIGSNNVGNRLLQKMGWSEGQGLGRKNQGRTNIIEANARNTNAGLGTKSGIGPGDDYKSYIKKMMKSRYESV